MDEREPKHRKKKPSDKSKSESRSDHKHEYEPCIVKFIHYSWAERCVVCGRVKATWTMKNRERNMELLREDSIVKPGIGLNDYLSVPEMKAKYPGVKVYEAYYEGHELKVREIFL